MKKGNRQTGQGRSSPTSGVRSQSLKIVLRTSGGDVCEIGTGKKLQELAMRWSYILRQRHRWSRQADAADEMRTKAEETFKELGVTPTQLRKIARSDVVEVSIPYEPREEANAWEARVFPWEYLLSAATKQYRGGSRVIVVRHIDRRKASPVTVPTCLLVVVAAPGALGEHYEFSGEVQLVRTTLHKLIPKDKKAKLNDDAVLQSPTKEELNAAIRRTQNAVVHIAGIDTHQGVRLLEQEEVQVNDGLYFNAPRQQAPHAVDALEVARILTPAGSPPVLVGFNVWNSGSRLAPLAVGEGAGAAIGFEHTIDDSAAEVFFASFYRVWMDSEFDLLQGFRGGLKAIEPYGDRLRGSSIVLCSAQSLVAKPKGQRSRRTVAAPTSVPEMAVISREADPKLDKIRDVLEVEVVPFPRLNYALLHNGRSLLERLTLRFLENPNVHAVRDLEVTVQLHVGADSFPYRARLNLSREVRTVNLADRDPRPVEGRHSQGGVFVPLTSSLARSVDESIQTSIQVEVQWHDQVCYRQTHPVRLAPVDEWRFDDSDIMWLPSFVQPRDPAVQTIVASAQRYLMCLKDDMGAGFDGYQSYDSQAKKKSDRWIGVDQQVQALWAALLLDHRLHYINPPPSYSVSAQRLRTPQQILKQGRGTCIDLALLLASCLEWIEVYPVIVMLLEHAFPAYWRNLEAYEKFQSSVVSVNEELESTDRDHRSSSPTIPLPAWYSKHVYGELRRYVQNGDLVPLETVRLTSGWGFRQARDEAVGYFDNVRNKDFHSIVDVARARAEHVTPLPLCDG